MAVSRSDPTIVEETHMHILVLGGAGMVGLVYHTIYRHGETTSTPPSTPEKP